MKKPLFCLIAIAVAFGATVGARAATTTETLRNLRTAFAGESNAAHRYEQFAQKADAEGHAQVAKLFRAAAKSEGIHRERHRAAIKKLGGDTADVALDPVKAGSTADNLRAAIAGETHERDTMYPSFIATAKAEDARVAVRSLQAAQSAEKEHAKLYQQALDQLGQNPPAVYYVCRECGYTTTERPLKECVVCRENASRFVAIN